MEPLKWTNILTNYRYDSFTPQLKDARYRARAWCHEYNSWFPSKASQAHSDLDSLYAERSRMHKEIFGQVGNDVTIEPPFLLEYGCNTTIGDGVYANFNLTILDCALVTIGDRVMFGPGVSILTATHETEVQSRRDNIEYAKEITIGDDCWIGGHVVILPGVHIGEGCTIAAGSMVTRDIPSWSVAMGCPARVKRQVTPVGPFK